MFRRTCHTSLFVPSGLLFQTTTIAPLCDLAPKPKVIEADLARATKRHKMQIKKLEVLAVKQRIMQTKEQEKQASLEKRRCEILEKALERPWEAKHGKLTINAKQIYIEEKFPTAAKHKGETTIEAINRIGAEFKELPEEQRKPYEEMAMNNRMKRDAASAKVRNRRLTPYALFVREVYQELMASRTQEAKPTFIDASRLAAARWNALSADIKEEYAQRATALRNEARLEVYQLQQAVGVDTSDN